MPNSTELKFVIQISTMNSAHCAFLLSRAAFALAALVAGGGASTLDDFPARSRTSALASRAASAAAASASSSAVVVLLPSAMIRLPGREAPGTQGRDGANQCPRR